MNTPEMQQYWDLFLANSAHGERMVPYIPDHLKADHVAAVGREWERLRNRMEADGLVYPPGWPGNPVVPAPSLIEEMPEIGEVNYFAGDRHVLIDALRRASTRPDKTKPYVITLTEDGEYGPLSIGDISQGAKYQVDSAVNVTITVKPGVIASITRTWIRGRSASDTTPYAVNNLRFDGITLQAPSEEDGKTALITSKGGRNGLIMLSRCTTRPSNQDDRDYGGAGYLWGVAGEGKAEWWFQDCEFLHPGEHPFYLENPDGVKVKRCTCSSPGTTYGQIVNRVENGPAGFGDVLIEDYYASGLGAVKYPGLRGKAGGLTLVGVIGDVTIRNYNVTNTYGGALTVWTDTDRGSYGHDTWLQNYDTSGFASTLNGTAPANFYSHGRVVLEASRLEGAWDRDAVQMSGCVSATVRSTTGDYKVKFNPKHGGPITNKSQSWEKAL